MRVINAVYEGGVFKPIKSPNIKEHQQVELVVVPKEGIVKTPEAVLKVLNYLKSGPFPRHSVEKMASDMEIDID